MINTNIVGKKFGRLLVYLNVTEISGIIYCGYVSTKVVM